MTNKGKIYFSKWALIGMSKDDYKAMYQRLRSEVKTILKQKYKDEYFSLLKESLEVEYNRVKGKNDSMGELVAKKDFISALKKFEEEIGTFVAYDEG